MTRDEVTKLLAEATPGPWRAAETWRPPIGNRPMGPEERTDGSGNVFWGYSITGSSADGGHILPTLGAVHNFPDQVDANARLIAASPTLARALLDALDRIETLEREKARLEMILAARDAYDAGEPSKPPVTGMEKVDLRAALEGK